MFSFYWEKFLVLLPNNKWATTLPPARSTSTDCVPGPVLGAGGYSMEQKQEGAVLSRLAIQYKDVSSLYLRRMFVLTLKYTH